MAMKKSPLVAKRGPCWWPDKSPHPVFVVSIRNCGSKPLPDEAFDIPTWTRPRVATAARDRQGTGAPVADARCSDPKSRESHPITYCV